VRNALAFLIMVALAICVGYTLKRNSSPAVATGWDTEKMDAAYPRVKQDPSDPLKGYPVVKHDK
jgi:hypothetical protein